VPNKFGNIVFNHSPLCFKRSSKSFNSTSRSILIVVLMNPIPKCSWSLASTYCGILRNMEKTTTKFFPFLLFVAKIVLETYVLVCYDILLTMFVQKHFWCLILCEKVVTKKDFSDETSVFYARQSVWWAFASVLLLVHIERSFVNLQWKCSYISICVLSFCCISKSNRKPNHDAN